MAFLRRGIAYRSLGVVIVGHADVLPVSGDSGTNDKIGEGILKGLENVSCSVECPASIRTHNEQRPAWRRVPREPMRVSWRPYLLRTT